MRSSFLAARLFCAIVLVAVLPPGLLLAQPGGGPPRGPGGPGGFFGGGGVLGLAAREEVQQELQLIDSQQEAVLDLAAEAREQMANEMREFFSQIGDFRNMTDDDRQELRERIQDINRDMEAKLKRTLLPHQFERLKQIEVQSRIQQQGAAALTSGELAEALDLTDDQQEKLQQRAAEVEQELREKVAQLRIEARNKLLDVLTPEQRAKLDSMMGDAFALPDVFGPGGFQGRGGRGFFGGRGGDRQGGRGRQPRASDGAN